MATATKAAQGDPAVKQPRPDLLNCDLVMKGGITSGLVYPKAVARLSQRYQIRSIGGTSIGAIAAALTAAAEYWRQTADPGQVREQRALMDAVIEEMEGNAWDSSKKDADLDDERALVNNPQHGKHGFAGLYQIPEDVGRDLLGMFQPSWKTRGLFSYVVTILRARTGGGKLLAAVWRQFYLTRLVVAVLVGLLGLSLLRQPSLGWWIAAPIVALVAVLIVESLYIPVPKLPGSRVLIWLAGVFLLLWPLALIDLGLGWRSDDPIGPGLPWLIDGSFEWGSGWRSAWNWVQDWVSAHPEWSWALVGITFAIVAWKWVRLALLSRFEGDTRRTVTWALNAVAVLVFLVVVAYIVRESWDWLSDHRRDTGAFAAGFAVGWIVGGVVALLTYLMVAVPNNFNGICTGTNEPSRWVNMLTWTDPNRALTVWLTRKIDEVAGIDPPAGKEPIRHLTFGDLDQQNIQFEAITSELRRGVPLDVPQALESYAFRPREFLRLFPGSVVTQLLRANEATIDPSSSALVAFPEAKDIPVIVAARMSMSFPVLFSAVPVYHACALKDTPDHKHSNWLSDGGIVSNFPIHKFDRALPPWPTFAFDLKEEKGVAKPADVRCQIDLNPIPQTRDAICTTMPTGPISGLQALASHILNTARGWMDNSQKALPGYAERIVVIRLYDGEGGMNLDMDAKTVRRLADRGMCGAHLLMDAWEIDGAPGQRRAGNQWDQHRWLRYRMLMREIEQVGREWTWVFAPASASLTTMHQPPLATVVDAGPHDGGPYAELDHRWKTSAHATQGAAMTAAFNTFGTVAGSGVDMDAGFPWQAGLEPDLFDHPHAPYLHPRRLMIPPFR